MELTAVADGLYALAPAEFVAQRDATAVTARREGDRELAAAIKALRRPTVSAWLANQVVRAEADGVEELLRLGDALREAQAGLAGGDLRRLSQDRHRLISSLMATARSIARDQGQTVTDATAREVEATFTAATVDPDAAAALRGGHLVTPLHRSGFGSMGLGGEPGDDAGPARQATSPPPRTAGRARPAAPPTRPDPGRRRAEDAHRAAEAAAADADTEARTAARRVEDAARSQEQADERVAALEAELGAARTDQKQAAEELEAARRMLKDAAAAQRRAESQLTRAQRAVQRLDE